MNHSNGCRAATVKHVRDGYRRVQSLIQRDILQFNISTVKYTIQLTSFNCREATAPHYTFD